MKTLIGGVAVAALFILAHYIVNAAADIMTGFPIAMQSLIIIASFIAFGYVFVKVAIND